MPHVKFTTEYRHREAAAAERVYPAGWEGEVSPEVAAGARKAGAVPTATQKAKANPVEQPKAKPTGKGDGKSEGKAS